MEMKTSYDTYNARVTTFNTAKTAYDLLKDAYNTKVAAEKTRRADFMRQLFEAPITIPARPCKPDQLPLYTGLSWKPDVSTTAVSAWTAANKAEWWASFTMNTAL